MNRDVKILCYGGGINSVAVLLESARRGIIYDAILFSDPGSEKKQSYEYTALMNEWCKQNGQREITHLYQVNKSGDFVGLYNDCMHNGTLPAIAYGNKQCSIKFKRQPQDKFCNNWELSRNAWCSGYKVCCYIGFDADETHRMKTDYTSERYKYRHPLVEWNWGRFECSKRILDEGLTLPPKSSCTFCPSMKPYEIIELYETERPAYYRTVTLERNAASNLDTVKGLGRSYGWWDLIVAYRYIERIKRYGLPQQFPKHLDKLFGKIKRSKPKVFNYQATIAELFRSSVSISCDCFDGE